MTTQTPENTSDVTFELTALDRCDSCGAQAYVRVRLQSGELYFCGHHAAEAKPRLEAVALEWHDETARISANSPE